LGPLHPPSPTSTSTSPLLRILTTPLKKLVSGLR
jgi:hypothetical protein